MATKATPVENEFRVIGPPGTGKTDYLSKQVKRACDAGRRPLITSLTKAAAAEIASRIDFRPAEIIGDDFDSSTPSSPFAEEQVGTLHAHCFRSLGSPQMIAKSEHTDDWNAFIAKVNTAWELSPQAFIGSSEERQRAGMGDELYATYSIMRAKMTPDSLWPIEIRGFAEKFREWKTLSGLFDFTDLIETCLRDVEHAPFDPDSIFVDEAQDHDRLELSLVRKWARHVERMVVCGDTDQNLYEFRGAEPDAFYAHEIPADHYRVLSKSYRVPRAIHAASMAMINRIEDRRPVEYTPKDAPGEVRKVWIRSRDCSKIVAQAQEFCDAGKSVMVLASCEYMLGGLIKFLREAGIPFHNPYAPNRGNFNPLGDRDGVTSPQRLMSFLRCSEKYFGDAARLWTWEELNAWADPVDLDGFMAHGAKKKLKTFAAVKGGSIVDVAGLRPLLHPETGMAELQQLTEQPLAWYRRRLNGSRKKAFDFPFAVIEKKGVRGLTEKPKIMIGTIHSVKGGEADVVMVFPDLSPIGVETYSRNPASIYRAFYVAMTRAKETLLLCQNSNSMAIRWTE